MQLLPRCRELAGDAVTGVLLSTIVRAFTQDSPARVNRHGLHWIMKTREDWVADTGLTLDQYRRAIAVLKTKDLVEVRVIRVDGVTRGHVRLLQPIARFLPAFTEKSSGKGIIPFPNSTYSISSKDSRDCVQVDLAGKVHAPRCVKESGISVPGEEGTGERRERTEIGEIQERKRGWMMKAADVLKNRHASATGSLGAYWKSRCALVSDTYQKPLTHKEQGQLKLLQGYLGERTRPVIAFAVEHWWKFATRAATAAGCACPSEPHIGFLLKHHAMAVHLLPVEMNPPTVVVEEPVQPIAPAGETEPAHTLSSQELTELLAELKSP